MVEVVKYSSEYKAAWDAFVAASKNGTFILCRDYMEYHADRFQDYSLLFYFKGRLVALLPAHAAGEEVHAHDGLSYGGIISGKSMKTAVMLQVFEAMRLYFKAAGFQKLKYKAIPAIYHKAPAEEDLYALFRNQAQLYRRDANSVIAMGKPIPNSRKRRWEVAKAKRGSIEVALSEDYEGFMEMERRLLQEKYTTTPTHTTAEIARLASLFPKNIKLYVACRAAEMVAGAVIYETSTVAHCQYMSSTAQGREAGALDVLLDYLLTKVYAHKKYFSFGISTEKQGLYLNTNLIQNKESYGARTIVHDFYELAL